MSRPSADHVDVQLRATRALLKFCEEHDYSEVGLAPVRECLAALQRKDIEQAVASYRLVPLGGNGCFNDWFPPVVFPHEDGDYSWAVFDALVERWSRLMSLSTNA